MKLERMKEIVAEIEELKNDNLFCQNYLTTSIHPTPSKTKRYKEFLKINNARIAELESET